MTAPTFRLADDGQAHVMLRPGVITARCGRDCRGPEVTTGRPCRRCLDLATAAALADDDADAAPVAARTPGENVAAIMADLGLTR